MTALQTIEQIGNTAVQKLRLQKLRSGNPFMINSKELEPNQCYLEYPDGTIQLVYLKNAAKDFTIIRVLSVSEEEVIRVKYHFPRL
jgi:hypothetical protein